MKKLRRYVPLDWLLERAEVDLTPELYTVFRLCMEDAPVKEIPEDAKEDGIIGVYTPLVSFDSVETYSDCTVQILSNSSTGECSVGWWKNSAPPVYTNRQESDDGD